MKSLREAINDTGVLDRQQKKIESYLRAFDNHPKLSETEKGLIHDLLMNDAKGKYWERTRLGKKDGSKTKDIRIAIAETSFLFSTLR